MWRCSWLFPLLLLAPWALAQPERGPFHKIAVIHIKDKSDQPIDPSLKASVLRRIDDAKAWGADCVILDIESYGGLVTASVETGQEILELGNTVHTIAYVHRRAISGAAMIALSCREIIMSEAATLGDSQAIYIGPDGTFQVAPEKSQTTVAAEFRKYAERNGYPIPLAEAMVRQDMEVFRYRRPNDPGDPSAGHSYVFYRADQLPDLVTVETERLTDQMVVVRAGELATFTAKEAREYGFASRLIADIDTLVTELSAEGALTNHLKWSGSEKFSRWLLSVRGWLFLLAAVAGYIAFKTPGTGVPEAVAILLFGLFFGASALAGFAEIWEIVLFFAGVALILLELFVLPGFGVPGFAGLLLVLLSLALVVVPPSGGADQYGSAQPFLLDLAWELMWAGLAATVAAFFIAKHLPKVPFFRRLSLATPESGSSMASQAPTHLDPLVGAVGSATSDLRPAGRARIAERDHDVVTEGAYVPAGGSVRVIEVRGPVIVVRPEGSGSDTATA
ncbi:MAG: NfeD family protein [Planctomycetota bacterium]|jgi:membrane-bound serine protease (ClpP class)